MEYPRCGRGAATDRLRSTPGTQRSALTHAPAQPSPPLVDVRDDVRAAPERVRRRLVREVLERRGGDALERVGREQAELDGAGRRARVPAGADRISAVRAPFRLIAGAGRRILMISSLNFFFVFVLFAVLLSTWRSQKQRARSSLGRAYVRKNFTGRPATS